MKDNTKGWDTIANQFVPMYGTRKFHLLNGADYYQQLLCERDYLIAYNNCPPLKSVVSKRASVFGTGVIQVVNKNTDKPTIGAESKALISLLEKPNVLQTWDQFFSQLNHYTDIFGYCPILKIRSLGFNDISAVWCVPPWLFDITYTRAWLQQTQLNGIYKSFFMNWNGQRVELNFEDVFFIFDKGIGTEDDTNLTIPDSRLVGLDYPISNIIAAYKSRNTLITKRGAIGILSNTGGDKTGFIPLKEGQKEELQQDFSKYGITGQPFQVIITDAQLKWQQMGYPTRELMLFEEIEDDINRICDSYDYPPELLSRKEGATYENRKEATKALYRDTIIPEACSRVGQLSAGLVPSDSILEVYISYEDVEILQEDKKIIADIGLITNQSLLIQRQSGIISRNEWREAVGLPKITNDPKFDEYEITPQSTTAPAQG